MNNKSDIHDAAIREGVTLLNTNETLLYKLFNTNPSRRIFFKSDIFNITIKNKL